MKYLSIALMALALSACATTEKSDLNVVKSEVEQKEEAKKKCKRSKRTTGVRTSRTNCTATN